MVSTESENSMRKWDDKKIMKFIQCYKRSACLWKMDHEHYKHKLRRQEAYENMVAEMGIRGFGVIESKIKIKNIRSHYCQELKKINMSREMSFASGGEVYQPSLVWFNRIDSFLKPYVSCNEKNGAKKALSFRPPPDETDLDIDDEDIMDTSKMDAASAGFDEDIMIEFPVEVEDNKREEQRKIPLDINRRFTSNAQPRNEHTVFIPEYSSMNSGNPEAAGSSSIAGNCALDTSVGNIPVELYIFGQSVAAQLNSLPFSEALQLQLKIQSLITEERLKLHKKRIKKKE